MRNKDGYDVKAIMNRTALVITSFADSAPNASAKEQMLVIARFAANNENIATFDCDELMVRYSLRGDPDAHSIVRVAMNIRSAMSLLRG